MICYVCQKKIKDDKFQRLNSETVRHHHCAPTTKNFQKAYPDAWSNKYVQKEKEEVVEEVKPKRRLLRIKKGE